MEKSRSPGKTSLHCVSPEDAAEKLRLLCGKSPVKDIVKALGSDADLHLVGGIVRDTFADSATEDIDMATVFHPPKVAEKLSAAGIKVVETGLKHGTVTAVISGRHTEITTFRKPAPHYVNNYSETIEEDLGGRDFTINAVAYSVNTGKIADTTGGVKDMQQNLLRAAGSAGDRFTEDPLRILRMIRFGAAAGRTTEQSMQDTAKRLGPLLKNVSVERIRSELEKILMAPFAAEGIRALNHLELLQFTIPELIPSVGFEQNRFHTEDVFEHTLTVLENCPHDLTLRLAAIFHDIGKPHTLSVDEEGNRHFYEHEIVGNDICKEVMKRLKFSNDQIDSVSNIVRLHMRPLTCGPAGLRRLMRDLGDQYEPWKVFKSADATPIMDKKDFEDQMDRFLQMERDEIERLKKSKSSGLAIDGNDLIALGQPPGVELGNILKTLENLIIEDPEQNTREILTEKAKQMIQSSGGK